MKKKLFSLLLSVLLIAVFASCTASQETSTGISQSESSVPESVSPSQSDSLSEDEGGDAVSDVSSQEIDESEFNNDASESYEISDGYGCYIIVKNEKNGYYSTTFTMATEGIKFEDGRILPFTYESLEYSGEDGEHIAEINGHKFVLNEHTDYEGTLCQTLECIDEIEGFSRTASVIFYPELEYGNIVIGFTYENNENNYVFTFLDGHTEEKTVLTDEENGRLYFE